ncbi:MAG: hypothetical protein ACP5U2_16635, partial [Bryobacteraceae bacterium]
FRAETRRPAAATRIVALMTVRGPREDWRAEPLEHQGWLGLRLIASAGRGELWAQLEAGAPGPAGYPEAVRTGKARMAGRWNQETLMVD